MEDTRKSIIEMARGAFIERVDYEMNRVVDNILDPNTKATEKRKVTITLTLQPDDLRQNVNVAFAVKSALAATNPLTTSLYIAGEATTGEMQEVEQPESQFLIRVSERGIKFVEADGGMWKLTARQTVKAYLEDKLSQEILAGTIVVAL